MSKPTRERADGPLLPPLEPKLFLGLTRQQRDRVIKAGKSRSIRAKQTICRAGEPARRMFFLKHGRAKYVRETSRGEEVLISWLTPGYVVGMGALLSWPERYLGTAQTISDCELLSWSRETIQSLTAAYPLLSQNVLRITLKALAAYTDRLIRLATGTAKERLAHTLIRLCYRIGHVKQDAAEVAILNEELASLADVSPFTASRQLQEWERQGILEKRRGRIRVLVPERLLVD